MSNWNKLKDMNFPDINRDNCCDDIMINSGKQFYCNKYDLLIEHGGVEETAVALMCAQHNMNNDICWAKTKCAFALYKERNESQEIIKLNDENVERNPEDPNNYITRGMLNTSLFTAMNSRRSSFSPSWKKVLEEHFNNEIKEYADKVFSDFAAAVKLGSNDASIFAFRGQVYSQLGQQPEALANFNEAIRLNPECINAYEFRGLMYFEESGKSKENADYDKAVENIDKAVADIEKVLKIDPNEAETTYLNKQFRDEKEVVYRLRRER